MKIVDETKEVATQPKDYLVEIEETNKMCALLMKTPHFEKMKQEGIFAIIQTAKSLNLDPIQALQGGLHIVNGKVEMGSRMMGALIRSKKHSITRDSRSNDSICILHGKRADTGDCWTESFSIEEAQTAGIYNRSTVWKTYPRDMLYARALSRLARQLFPDVIGNCYVEGELKDDPGFKGSTFHNDNQDDTPKEIDKRSEEEVKGLLEILDEMPEYKQNIESFLAKKDIANFEFMPKEMYSKVLENAKKKMFDKFENEKTIETIEVQDEEN